jgi:protein-S-isoprenylcysteine O-methyltransferase Ste14
VIATPVLIKGFAIRGSGRIYESDFSIQRLPQYAALVNVILIALGFLAFNGSFAAGSPINLLAGTTDEASSMWQTISWVGVAILVSGMIFMVGGWYSLGECFSTDAEVLNDHKVKNTGLLKWVMHPIYSGIIQCLLGASVAATSLVGVLFCVLVTGPLWLRRAKYEERLLIENLGEPYKEYAEQTKWRRLVPKFFPIGV